MHAGIHGLLLSGMLSAAVLSHATETSQTPGPVASPPSVGLRGAPPVSPLEAELTQLLDANPDANDFPVHANALRYEEGPEGVHYALVVDVALPPMRAGRSHPHYQILVRLKNAQDEVVQHHVAARAYTILGDPRSGRLRLVWTRQAQLRPGRYTLETIVRNARLMTSARRVTFEARSYGNGPRVSSVALLLPDGAQRLDDTLEADDPFRLEGRPLMPALAPRAAAGAGAKVEFIANAYPDPANAATVAVRAELLRGGEVLASQALSQPPADERGALRCAGAMPIGKLQAGEYQIRIVAVQGDASSQEEATFAVEWRPRATGQTWPKMSRGELIEIARMRHHDQAISRLKRLDQTEAKGDPEVLYLLSARYLSIRAYADAEKAARRAAELTEDPTALAEIHYALARALSDGEKQDVNPRSERLRAAEASLRKAIDLTDGQVERFHVHLASVLSRLERGAEARGLLAEILERPDLPEEIAAQARSLVQNARCVTEVCLPELSFVTPAGEHRTSADLRGKVVLLSFWATWCAPCMEALPGIKDLHARYAKEPFALIGISWDQDRDVVEAFLAKNKLTWPQLTRREASGIGKRLGVEGIPTEILFDHEGVALGRSRGWGDRTYFQLLGRVDGAVKKAKKALAAAPNGPSR